MLLVRKFLYSLGTVVALLAALAGGALAIVAAGRGAWGGFAAAAGAAILCAGFIWLAHRRTNALEAKRQAREQSETAAALEAALAAPLTGSRFVARRTVGSLAVLWAIALAVAAGAVLLWPNAPSLAVLAAVATGLLLWSIVPLTANRDAIVVDHRGVEVPNRYGLVPWRGIRGAHFRSDRHGLRRIVQIRLGVDDADAYRRPVNFLRRFLRVESGLGDSLEVVPLGLDRTPEEVFAAIRRFHERAVPKGTLVAGEARYRVDPQAARLDALHGRMLDLFAETRREADALERSGRLVPGTAEFKAFEQATERRLQEAEALGAESDRLTSAQLRELHERMERSGRSMSRITWLVYGGFALVLAVIVASAWLA
jgi:hypothetical protein